LIFVDSGIAANEIAADARALLRPGAPFGTLLESFVLSELSRQLTWSEQPAELFHYRDQSKFEVDAVLENRPGHVVGIEGNAASAWTSRRLRPAAPTTFGDYAASPTASATTS